MSVPASGRPTANAEVELFAAEPCFTTMRPALAVGAMDIALTASAAAAACAAVVDLSTLVGGVPLAFAVMNGAARRSFAASGGVGAASATSSAVGRGVLKRVARGGLLVGSTASEAIRGAPGAGAGAAGAGVASGSVPGAVPDSAPGASAAAGAEVSASGVPGTARLAAQAADGTGARAAAAVAAAASAAAAAARVTAGGRGSKTLERRAGGGLLAGAPNPSEPVRCNRRGTESPATSSAAGVDSAAVERLVGGGLPASTAEARVRGSRGGETSSGMPVSTSLKCLIGGWLLSNASIELAVGGACAA